MTTSLLVSQRMTVCLRPLWFVLRFSIGTHCCLCEVQFILNYHEIVFGEAIVPSTQVLRPPLLSIVSNLSYKKNLLMEVSFIFGNSTGYNNALEACHKTCPAPPLCFLFFPFGELSTL